MNVSIYDANTGKILRSITGDMSPADIAMQSQAAHEIIIDGAWDDAQFYVVEHEVVPRPVIDPPSKTTVTADDTDTLVFGGIPADTRLRILGPSGTVFNGTVDDGAVEWSTALAGEYVFVFTPPFPWQPARFEVTAE
jgi:hypothetical protein